MRNSELRTGIGVFDEKGEVVGTSKVAAKKVSQDELMCMCSKGPNALYSLVMCEIGNDTTVLHYVTIISHAGELGAATTEDMVPIDWFGSDWD